MPRAAIREPDADRRQRIQTAVSRIGFRGTAFEQDGRMRKKYKEFLVREYKKANTDFDKKSILVQKNINRLIPRGFAFNPQTNQFVKDTSYKGVRGKIFAKFKRRGLKLDDQGKLTTAEAERARRTISYSVGFKVKIRRKDKTKRSGYRVDTYNQEKLGETPYSTDWYDRVKEEIRQEILGSYTGGDEPQITFNQRQTYQKQLNNETVRSLENVRMRLVDFVIDGDAPHDWDKSQGTCVADWLRTYYNKDTQQSFGEKYLTDEAFDEVFEEGWKEEGICAAELLQWCEAMNITGIALNKQRERIAFYQPPRGEERKVKSLVFIVHNQHIHPVLDTSERRRQAQLLTDNVKVNNKKHQDKLKQEKESMMANIKTEYVVAEKHWDFLFHKMIETKTEVLDKNIIAYDGHLSSFILQDTQYIFETQESSPVKNWYDLKEKNYNGERPSNFAYEAMDKLRICKSSPNQITNRILATKNIKNRRHMGGELPVDRYGEIEDHKLNSFDINKSHSSILTNPQEEWMILNKFDCFKPYKGQKIKLGLYYVETTDRSLFVGNNIYSSFIVQYGLNLDYISKEDIKYYMYASSSKPKEYFKPLFEEYKNISGYDDEIEVAFNKALNNATSGILGKTSIKREDRSISTDVSEAFHYLHNNKDKNLFHHIKWVEHEGEKFKFHIAGNRQRIEKSEHNLPMFIQIYDQELVKLHQIYMKLGGRIVYRRCDTIILEGVHKGYEKFLSDEWGGIREQPVSNEYSDYITHTYPNIEVDWDELLFDKDWRYIDMDTSSKAIDRITQLFDQNKGCVIEGRAGSGKSFLLRKLEEYVGKENVIKIAFTNLASNNVEGQTFHKAFKLDKDGKLNSTSFNKLKTINAILVDEGSMVNGQLWDILNTIYERFQIPCFVFVDWRQLKPIENIDGYWKNHPVLKRITSMNYGTIKYDSKVGRYDKALYDFTEKYQHCSDFLKDGVQYFKDKKQTNKELDVNLAYTNKTVRFINESRMKYYDSILSDEEKTRWVDPYEIGQTVQKAHPDQLDDEQAEWMDEKLSICNEFSQPTIFYKGLKCMARQNNKTLDIYNGEKFTVIDFKPNPEGRGWNKIFYLITVKAVDSEKEITIPMLKWFANFSVSYAMTVHKAQGQTIKEPFTIWEYYHSKVDEHWLYTALTRATKLDNINIAF